MKKFFLFSMMLVASIFMVNAQNVGYLLTTATITDLPLENEGGVDQKPEQNAANWFSTTYGTHGTFVSLSDLSTLNPATISVLWINIDRVGLDDIKTAGISDAVIADLKAFVEAGGNLLLTKQATMIAHRIGRIYAPTFANGGYNLGGDVWAINPQLGLWWGIGQVTDRRSHPIYKDVEFDNTLFKYAPSEGAEPVGYPTLPLVGAVPRTDNNCMWIDLFRKDQNNPTAAMPATEGVTHYDNGNILRLQEFESDWNCQMLACWGHVLDFCSAGIVDMNPDDTFQGRVLGIGFAAYQWGTSNNYISNVQKLTQNSIEYLYGGDPTPGSATAIDNANDGAKATKTLRNGQVLILRDGKTYNTLGVEVK